MLQLCIINLGTQSQGTNRCRKLTFMEVKDGSKDEQGSHKMNADPCDVSLKCQESYWSTNNEVKVIMDTKRRHGLMKLDFLFYYQGNNNNTKEENRK